jgi:hypothetical protein
VPALDRTPVTDLVTRLLALRVPDLVGVHVVGSHAHGDAVPGWSDLDLVVVVRGRPDPTPWGTVLQDAPDLAGSLDLLVVDEGTLGGGERTTASALRVDRGRVQDGAGQLDAVLWRELGTIARTLHGDPIATRLRPVERGELDAALRHRTRRVWLPWLEGSDDVLARAVPDTPVTMATVEWAVLGSLRIEHTLRTGELASKRLALRSGLVWYGDRWSDVLEPVGAVRDGLGPDVVPASWARRALALAIDVATAAAPGPTALRRRVRV